MELNKLEVKSWRGVPQASIEFGRGITIIGGPNECGKTSLRTALHAALVRPTGLRNESKTLETFRTWETKLYPSVKLQFTHDGKLVDVEKEFLRKKDWSNLRVDGRLIATDGEVQRTLNQLLGDSLDWIEVLWGTQGLVAFDRDAPDSIKGKLAKAAQDTVIPQVAQLKDSIDKEYLEHWTPKDGKPNKRFQEYREQVFEAEKRVREMQQKIADANRQSAELEGKYAQLAIEKEKLSQVELEWANGQKSLGAWQTYERAVTELKIAENDAAALEQWILTWKNSVARISTLLPECQSWLQEIETLKHKVGKEPSTADLDLLRSRANYLELLITKEKREALEKIQVPPSAQMKELESIEDTLRNIEASLNAVAFRAELRAEQSLQLEIVRDSGEKELRTLSAAELSEWQAQQSFDLHLPGVASLHVESGDPAIAKKVAERDGLRKSFDEALAKWQVGNLNELRTRSAEKEMQLKQIAQVNLKELADLRLKVTDAGELDRLAMDKKEGTLQALSSDYQIAETNFKAAQSEYLQTMKSYQELLAKGKMSELRAVLANFKAHCSNAVLDSIKSLNIPQTIELLVEEEASSSSGVDDVAIASLSSLLSKAASYDADLLRVSAEKRALLDKQKVSLIMPEGEPITTELLEQKEKLKSELTEKVNLLSSSIDQTLGAISAQGDLHAQFVVAEESEARARVELDRVEAEAHAIKELRLAFDAARQKLQEDVVAPLQTRVTHALEKLTGGFYKGVAFDPALKISGVHASSATAVVLDEISFGTREQLSFLTRLCLAQLLANDSRQVVVLDDNLVHTDSLRMMTACQLLESASEQIQIVVFTCHPERYASIANATRVELDARNGHN
jgi:uncharacterized protein YhaN